MSNPDLVTLPDGRRAQLWQGGDPVGVAVFFLHGTPDTRHAAYSGDGAARRTGVRLVAVNRPGYGLSDTADTSHPSVADDTVAVADLLGIDRFTVLGMSLGGPYALATAARHPARVAAAGVVAAPGMTTGMDPPGHREDLSPDGQAFFARLAEVSVEEAIALMRPAFEQYVTRLAPGDPDDRALTRRLVAELAPEDAALLAALSPAVVAASAREALVRTAGYLRDAAVTFRDWDFRPEDVGCPAFLWYGGRDANAPERNGRWLAARIPSATLRIREGSTHLATLMNHWDDMLTTLAREMPQPGG